MVGPLYQRIGSNLAATGNVGLFSLMLCRAGTLDFLGSSRRPREITFRFPSHPSVDLFKRLPQRADYCTASISTDPHQPPPSNLHKTRCSIFQKQCKPCIHIAVLLFCFVFLKLMNLNKNCPKKTWDRNIKCHSVSARACHPSCCTLVSSDERQPPNM